MKKKVLIKYFSGFLICLSVFLLTGMAVYPQSKSNTDAWREDLQVLAKTIMEGHPNAFAKTNREVFERTVREIDQKIPSLKPNQIIVEMARLVALLHDGHSALGFTWDDKIAFRRLPIRFYLYSDGLFVQSASVENEKLLGAKVLRIGKFSADEALNKMRPIIHGDNEMAFKDVVTSRLSMPDVLQALNITDDTEQADFEFELSTGEHVKATFKPVAKGATVDLITARSKSKNPTPLYLKNPQEKYWFEYLKEQRIVYVKFNAVQNKDDESIDAFFTRVFKFVEENPVDKFILDMRHNNGGDNSLIKPIIHGIIKSEKINQRGKFFTVIGRLTFSAAQNTINEIEKHTNVTFVGEPSEGSPNHFGDAVNYVLPNSKIIARISSLRWQDQDPRDHRPWIAPQITAELSSQDYLTNRDPVFEAILNYKETKSLAEQLFEILSSNAANRFETMRQHAREFKSTPEHKFYDSEKELIGLAYQLADLKKTEDAFEVLKLNAELNPTSAETYRRLGESYEQAGNSQRSIENYKKALEFEPAPNIKFWLTQKINGK